MKPGTTGERRPRDRRATGDRVGGDRRSAGEATVVKTMRIDQSTRQCLMCSWTWSGN